MRKVAQVCQLAVCIAAVLLPPLAAANAADHPDITPGSWETTVTSEIPNMPPRPPMTTTHCVKAEDVKDSRSFAETMQQRSGKCALSDFKFDGGKLSYNWSCEGGNAGSTEFVFSGTSYEGTTKVNLAAHGNRGPMSITQHIKARRVGDC
jgi:Protein of unknown function (DUF3617)